MEIFKEFTFEAAHDCQTSVLATSAAVFTGILFGSRFTFEAKSVRSLAG